MPSNALALWLHLANLGLGVVVLAPIAAVLVGVLADLVRRRARRA